MIMKLILVAALLVYPGIASDADLCTGNPSAAALQRYLEGRSRLELPNCLRTFPLPEVPGGVALVGPRALSGGSDGLLVWRHQGAWRVADLPPGTSPVRFAGNEMIAGHWEGGSGGYGQIRLYRLGDELALLWESPVYEKFRLEALSGTLVLTGHRPEGTWDEPHAIMANCCLPSDGQMLWERQGERFVPKASRTIPNPYRAVSLFVGALRKGNRETALKSAWSPDVATPLDLDPQGWTDAFEEANAIEEAERRHWDAIAEALRSPAPTQTRMVWPSGKYSIITERRSGQWKVSAVEPSPGRP